MRLNLGTTNKNKSFIEYHIHNVKEWYSDSSSIESQGGKYYNNGYLYVAMWEVLWKGNMPKKRAKLNRFEINSIFAGIN